MSIDLYTCAHIHTHIDTNTLPTLRLLEIAFQVSQIIIAKAQNVSVKWRKPSRRKSVAIVAVRKPQRNNRLFIQFVKMGKRNLFFTRNPKVTKHATPA